MGFVNLITIAFLLVMVLSYVLFVQNTKPVVMGAKQQTSWLNIGIVLMVALLVRYLLACFETGYEVDMNCFQYWADMVYNDGFSKFYTSDVFADYPPGYVYILYVLGWIRHMIPSLAANTILIKMPAVICDLVTGALIYKMAHKHFDEVASIWFACFYLFNPVVLIDSAMWGQVDSVFTLCVVVMIYLIAEHKLIPAYFVFAIGILIKPQTLILTPVLGYGILDQIILDDKKKGSAYWQQFFTHLGCGLLAIASMFVLAIPYGVEPVWKQYTETLSSYPYASVNAYNFWEMFKLNWHSQDEMFLGVKYSTWGSVFIVLICVAATIFCVLNRKKKNGGKYFFYGAFIAAGFFTMSVRVHERYMFPVFALLLCAFLYQPKKEYLYMYMALTLAQVNNIWHAFKYYDPQNFDFEATFPQIIAVAHVLIFVYFIFVSVKLYVVGAKEPEYEQIPSRETHIIPMKEEQNLGESEYFAPRVSDARVKFTKFDWIAMLAITIIYGCIALFNLGDKDAPQSYWETATQGDCITLDTSNKTSGLTKMAFYNGRFETREYYLEESADGVNWTPVAVNGQDVNTLGVEAAKFNMESVFCWKSISFVSYQPYLRLRLNSAEAGINELVFFDEAGNTVVPNNATDYPALFDEQDLYPEESTFRDSTYFDEIYHGRTAYEMTRGLYNYEWTHPPLGKFIISIGVRIFGMCPFGWRIMGTLFGIAMLPIFYLFSRKLFKKTSIATFTTILLAADFMHFAQTRIATIDVFVTFFIILMYYFMYRYYRMSFYDTDLKKTFLPLLFCGISMGLGCAAKWPGVYAGIGLAVIFFVTLGRRYMEYRYAKANPEGESNGISHQDVIKKFKKNTLLTIAFCCLAFVVIPVTIYTLSYIPFNNGTDMGLVQRMLKNQMDMWNYHSKLDAEHPFSSCWYEWPIMKRPIWYFNTTLANGMQENISAFGNPLVWWIGIPAFVYMLYRVIAKKDRNSIFLSIAYLAQLLPWVGVTRCTFIYHYFPSVPFITLMIGYCMYQICQRKTKRGRTIALSCCALYVVAAIGLFCMFYPVLSGYPIDASYGVKYLRWFESWVLVQ